MKKHIIGHVLFFSALVLSFFAPMGYAFAQYSEVVTTRTGAVTAMLIVALAFSMRYILYLLKKTAHDGYGVSKELARELRYFIPLGIFLAVIMAIESNVAGISDVVRVTLILNLLAAPMRVLSYRFSKRYENDTAGVKLLKL